MSRYVKQFSFNGDPNVLVNMANQFFSSKGFKYKKYKGEWIYQKGNGFLVGPKFVKAFYNGTAFQLEAWIKMAVLPFVFAGEENLEGFSGIATKKPLKDMVTDFEMQLMKAGCQIFDPNAPVQPAATVQTPVTPAQPQPVQKPIQPAAPVQTPEAPAEEPKSNNFCHKCGNKLVPGSRFCSNCGTKFQ